MSSTILGTASPAFVAHADATVLYVNNAQGANCSDTGAGTQAQPFCTVQAAANVVQAGQTVQVAPGTVYPEQVTVAHSGTPGSPITFNGGRSAGQTAAQLGVAAANANAANLPHAFVLAAVHDVVVTGFTLHAPQEAVLVTGSASITVDGNNFIGVGIGTPAFPSATPAIRLTGKTTATTVSRNRIFVNGSAGVAVDAGVSGAVVTTNFVRAWMGGGVVVTDAPGTAVTSNSIISFCKGPAITLAGNSAGSTVENNVVGGVCPAQPELAVADASTGGTKADYNILPPEVSGQARYAWGTGTYTSLDAFRAATGQAAHDLAENASSFTESGATDSADANAPGELATDIDGRPRVDDPNVVNTGTGVGYYDRGAFELQDGFQASVSAYGVGLLQAAVPVSLTGAWGPVTSTVDFGDGSPKASPTAPGTLAHTFPGPGTYTVTLTATDGILTRTGSATVTIAPVDPVKPWLSARQADGTVPQMSFSIGALSPWPVAKYVLDFGDGSPVSEAAQLPSDAPVTHRYPHLGTYNVSLTVTDDHGRSQTLTQPVEVATLLPLNRTIERVGSGGWVSETYSDSTGWYDSGMTALTPVDSGPFKADALSLAYSPSGDRVIEASQGGVLHEIYPSHNYWYQGWYNNPVWTVYGLSALSFQYSPSGARVIEAIERGELHEIYSAPDGWHDNPIAGVGTDITAMTFSYSPSGARVIEAIEGGVLHEIYSAADGWHDNPIAGVAPNATALSFTYNASGQRVIEAVVGGVLHEVYSDWDGWHDAAIPGAGADIKGLSVKLRPTGDRVIEAVENNEVHEVYSNAGAWFDSVVPLPTTGTSAVSLALR